VILFVPLVWGMERSIFLILCVVFMIVMVLFFSSGCGGRGFGDRGYYGCVFGAVVEVVGNVVVDFFFCGVWVLGEEC